MRALLPLALAVLTGCTFGGGRRSAAQGAAGAPPAGALVLRVVPTRPAPPVPGRVIVLWAPIGDDDDSFLPELGYEAPFFGNEPSVVIPYQAIVPPRRLQLFPPCLGRGGPGCDTVAGVATAYVLVVPSTGRPVDGRSVGKGEVSAVGRVILGFGTMPVAAGGPLRDVFPGGIAAGIAPYSLARPPGSSFDDMWLAARNAPFDLVTCTLAEPRCDLPMPNLN
jgi:hypothetical protein